MEEELNYSLAEDFSEEEEIELHDVKIEAEKEDSIDYIKMDYSLETPEERNEKVKEIIANTPFERLTPRYLEKLADYIVFALDKQEKKEKKILTDNRMITLRKRETSFEGLVSHFENNENTGDMIYNMITNDKNIIFNHKKEITAEDLAEIPGLKELKEKIEETEELFSKARGKRAYALKKQIIEMRQDQYIYKNSYKPKMGKNGTTNNTIKGFYNVDLSEKITLDKNKEIKSSGILSLFRPDDVSLLLCNYSKIKEDVWSNFNADIHWLMMDLDDITDIALKDYPIYVDIVIHKIDGLQNIKIQEKLKEKYGTTFSIEYISSLWRNKIPKLIAEEAQKQWLEWHYTFEEKGYWKKCGRCGQIKLGHIKYFSKNSTSKDKLYSICKECRNKKKEVK